MERWSDETMALKQVFISSKISSHCSTIGKHWNNKKRRSVLFEAFSCNNKVFVSRCECTHNNKTLSFLFVVVLNMLSAQVPCSHQRKKKRRWKQWEERLGEYSNNNMHCETPGTSSHYALKNDMKRKTFKRTEQNRTRPHNASPNGN